MRRDARRASCSPRPSTLEACDQLKEAFGAEIAALAAGVEKLYQLRLATRANPAEQNEVLRKMVLGMVEDVRVVLIRLASRTQTLRWFAKNPSPSGAPTRARRLDIYSPLANRLGVCQLKWELEDLSFRFLEPELYKRIAQMLDEKRVEREHYIADAIAHARRASSRRPACKGEISGRPKHIYSIWNKMRSKALDFAQVYDVRALRVIVPEIKDCYTALGVVHNLWQPIPKEFDDYISRPKGNLYQSLHTAVVGPRGQDARSADPHRGDAPPRRVRRRRALALQGEGQRPSKAVRAEDRVAARAARVARRGRRLGQGARQARLDDTVYVLTPQGKVIDLPAGRDAGRLRLRAAHRPRPPLPRRARSTATSCRSTRRSRAASASRSSRRKQAGRRATG